MRRANLVHVGQTGNGSQFDARAFWLAVSVVRVNRTFAFAIEPREGACLTVTQAYQVFCRLAQQRSLNLIKRSMFREMMRDLVREKFNLALRHDVPDASNRHQQAWKGLALVNSRFRAA